jgi:hypothetical protein
MKNINLIVFYKRGTHSRRFHTHSGKCSAAESFADAVVRSFPTSFLSGPMHVVRHRPADLFAELRRNFREFCKP